MIYAIAESYLQKIAAFRKDADAVVLRAIDLSNGALTAESMLSYFAKQRDAVSRVENGTMHINIEGPLLKSPDAFDYYYGGFTMYGDIISAIDAANKDVTVSDILLHINSPGGTVSGADEAAMAVKNSKKPVKARVEGMAASAAYWIASQASEIVASSPADDVGSIGVVAEYLPADGDSIIITTAKNKRPDIETDEGRAAVLRNMADIHKIFVARVSEGRGISADVVDSDAFGSGWVVTAKSGKSVGMVDRIENEIIERADPAAEDINADEFAAQINQEEPMDENAIKESERANAKAFMQLAKLYPDQSAMIESDMLAGKSPIETMAACSAAALDKATAAAAIAAEQKASADVPDVSASAANLPPPQASPYDLALAALGLKKKE